jgi:TPR repeat protein
MRTPTSFLAACVVLVPFIDACGGTPAEAVRPKDPTAAGALGEAQCHKVEKYGEPLVVDWKPDQRGDLEEAMHDGVALVAYSCSGIKLLKQCKLDGSYGFLGMTKREQVVRLENADEVRANLPLSGLKIAGDISAEMDRGATLDIALITVGKRRTTWKAPTRDDLKGDCDGVTHFVRGAAVGAFALQTGTRAQVRSAAQVFGVGAAGSSTSGKQVHDTEGNPDDCGKATPDATTPPGQCGGAVRLELVAIEESAAPKPPPKGTTETTGAAPPAPQGTLSVPEEPCPEGLVHIEGKCALSAVDKPHQCEPADEADCAKQCDKGHAGSCGALGAIGHRAHAWDKAASALKKGCDLGDARSCVNLGEMTSQGLGMKADPAAAVPLFQNGCSQGDAVGCARLGSAYRAGTGVPHDDARAAPLFRKACDGGQAPSCGELGSMTHDGAGGVAKDDKAAAALLKRGCDGADARSCNILGDQVAERDPIGASILYQRACWGAADFKESGKACASLGRVLQVGPMANDQRSKDAYQWACNKMNALGCASLKIAFGDPRPVFPDVAEQNSLQSMCSGGNARGCAMLGVLQIASGNAMGKGNLDRACMMNDKWACAMKAKAH